MVLWMELLMSAPHQASAVDLCRAEQERFDRILPHQEYRASIAALGEGLDQRFQKAQPLHPASLRLHGPSAPRTFGSPATYLGTSGQAPGSNLLMTIRHPEL